MQNRSGIVGNSDSVSRVVIFLIQKPYAEQHCPVFCQLERWPRNDSFVETIESFRLNRGDVELSEIISFNT